MNRWKFIFVLLFLQLLGQLPTVVFAQESELDSIPKNKRLNRIMFVKTNDEVHCYRIVKDMDLYRQGWDTLEQVMFWNDVCTLEPEYSAVYDMKTREMFAYVSTHRWYRCGAAKRSVILDSVRREYGLPAKHELSVAAGRSDFYLFQETIPNIHKAVDIFIRDKTDPWYAQAILLIESPGNKIKTSYTGACGAFQIMPEVAADMGLIVNETVDERKDFAKSAKAAAGLLRKSCIPQAKAMLNKRGIKFYETDLWFRLLVMHCYHAGPGNVATALNKIAPKSGGMWLIQKLWKTSVGGFQNESQNYSQIAVAAVYELMKIVEEQGDIICDVKDLEF
ncbi:MAG: transglycosylase SLT domain-containing protein [Bacteroidia bacterium]